MNTLFVLLDGAEDDPNPLMDGRKPYEVAEMPFLKRKACHRLTTTGRGYTHLFLNEFFTGHPPEMPRAAIEAMGMGLDMRDPSRTAYRLSPADIGDGENIHWLYGCEEVVKGLRASAEENLGILGSCDPEIVFFGEKAILTIRSDDVPELPAPPVDAPLKMAPGPVGDFVAKIAEENSGMTFCPWGCGKFGRQYEPVPGIGDVTAISNSPVALGVCASLGYKIQYIEPIEDRFPAAVEALKHGDVFLHIDEVDEYSHMKDPFRKKAVLELTDRLMEEHFSDWDNIVYFVDHGTSCVTGEHILMDVPLWTSIDAGFEQGAMVPLKDVVRILMESKR